MRKRLLDFPGSARQTLSEQGRPEDGTDDEGVNMSETFVRLKPARRVAARAATRKRLIQAMRASLTEIPGVSFNFSQPDQGQRRRGGSGVRGQVVLKIFGTDLDVMQTTLEQAKDVA